MPSFSYIAQDAQGQKRRGTTESSSAAAAVQTLRERGWLVLEVGAPSSRAAAVGGPGRSRLTIWLRPRSVDVEISLSQLAVMLRSGLVLLAALHTVADQSRRAAMRRVWRRVAERIQAGSSLSEALAEHRCFGRLVVQLARVGEATGMLDVVLTRAAQALEARRQLRTSMLTALAYPAIVMSAAIGVAAYMVLGVIPKLQVFLKAGGRRLPAVTQLLIDGCGLIQAYALQALLALLGLLLAAAVIRRWPAGRIWMDRLLLRLPLIGHVLRLSATASFARAMGILLRSGITVLEALRSVEGFLHNSFIGACVAQARVRVMRGEGLSEPLSTPGGFLPMLGSMVAVAETTGTLDDVLDEVAHFHESQLQSAIRRLGTIVEPIIIIVVGGIVGFVYLSFFAAMISATGVR